MRRWLVAVVLLAGCEHHQVTAKTAASYARPLATDSLPFLFERAKVRGYMADHRWCQGREWPHSDEFVECVTVKRHVGEQPPVITLVRYDAVDRLTALAVFTPVACRHDEYGDETCDALFGRRDFHDAGLILRTAGCAMGWSRSASRRTTRTWSFPRCSSARWMR